MAKLFFYDLETTGTNPYLHSIHQISGAIYIDGVQRRLFNAKIQPNPFAQIDDEALAVGGITRGILPTYTPFVEAYKFLVDFLAEFINKFDKKDKFFLVGYNNTKFDDVFFRAFFEQNHDKFFGSWFWGSSIDVISLATDKLKDVRHEMEDFKLKTVAKKLGIAVDETKLHDAMYDIGLTIECYHRLMLS